MEINEIRDELLGLLIVSDMFFIPDLKEQVEDKLVNPRFKAIQPDYVDFLLEEATKYRATRLFEACEEYKSKESSTLGESRIERNR